MSMYGLGIRTVWYRNGLPHRRDPHPAVVQTGAEGRVIEQSWFINGEFRNDHRPSTIDPNSSKWKRTIGRTGAFHRLDDLPAVMGEQFEWWKDGRQYKRDRNLPIQIWPTCMTWWVRDDDGPVYMDADGRMEWLVMGNGCHFSKIEKPPPLHQVEAYNVYKARFLSYFPICLADRFTMQRGFLQACDFPDDQQ